MTYPAVGLVLAIGLGLSGCGQDFLIGVLDGDGSGDASASTTVDPTTGPSSGPVTITEGLDTTAGSGSASATSSGPDSSGEAGASSSTGDLPVAECEAPKGHSVCDTDGDPFHAIGLGCVGGPRDTQPILDPQLQSTDPSAWRVIREYGNPTWGASEGSNVLAMSTGSLPMPDGSGLLQVPLGQTDAPGGGNNGNPDGVGLPGPVQPVPGSMGGAGGQPFEGCDGIGDCSDSLPLPWQAGGPARDLAWMSFDIDVPAGALGYQVDLAWFSTEFPARASQAGTDVTVWWQSSEAFTGNVATLDGAALSASTATAWLAAQGVVGPDPTLASTGYEGTTGSACNYPGGSYPDCPRGVSTGWLTLNAPSEPGETMSIVVAVFDLLDANRDTTVLIDNWRWYCPGCQPGVDCGLAP